MFLVGAEPLCGKVADILLSKSVDMLCLEGGGRSLSWQRNCCVRAPLKTNSVPKTAKTLSYKICFNITASTRMEIAMSTISEQIWRNVNIISQR